MKKLKKITLFALFLSMALLMHWVENLVMPFNFLPGFKLGLANSLTLTVLLMFGTIEAFAFALIRAVLGSIGAGFFLGPVFYLTLGGSVASVLLMGFVHDFFGKFFSEIGLGIAGAVAYNSAQVAILSWLWRQPGILTLLPWIMVISIIPGFVVGALSMFIRSKLLQFLSI